MNLTKNMSTERTIAASLIEKSIDYHTTKHGFNVLGHIVVHPYTYVHYLPYDEPVFENQIAGLKAMDHLFSPENLPSSWADFITEAGKLREHYNSRSQIDLIFLVYHLIQNNLLANIYHLPRFSMHNGELNLSDEQEVKAIVNNILENPFLKQKLLELSTIYCPTCSGMDLMIEDISELLTARGFTSGYLLDLGCGLGEKTPSWAETGLRVIGIDRQYYPDFFPLWHRQYPDYMGISNSQNITYVRSDFIEGLPFQDNSITVAVMYFVAHHITETGLEKGLKEVKKVLINQGLLLVCPQEEQWTKWRVFEKVKAGNISRLVEITLPKPDWMIKYEQ